LQTIGLSAKDIPQINLLKEHSKAHDFVSFQANQSTFDKNNEKHKTCNKGK